MLDVNVIVSAVLSRAGTPARVLRAWNQGEFELVLSSALLGELARTLAYTKISGRIPPAEARRLIRWLETFATVAEDPSEPPPVRSPDPGDDYLIALAAQEQAVLVSGDEHLLGLAAVIPARSPAAFLRLLEERRE